MRAPVVCLLVTFVAAGAARAELPHLVQRLAAGAERVLGSVDGRAAHDAVAPLLRVRRHAQARLGVTGAMVVPTPPKDVAAVTRVEGLAVRAFQPRVEVQSQLVHAVRVTPMWPFGAYVTLEYTLPFRR